MTAANTNSSFCSFFPYNSQESSWTESDVNNLTVRWGGGGGGFAGAPDYTSVLLALGIEVLIRDEYPAAAPDTILSKPIIEAYTGTLGSYDTNIDFNYQPIPSLNACAAHDKRVGYPASFRVRPNAVDPYLRGKVGWHLNIYDSALRQDIEVYWRITPAYDINYPGFDGSFHDSATDRANGTTSAEMLTRWLFPLGEDWWSRNIFRSFPLYRPFLDTHITWPYNMGDNYSGFDEPNLEPSYVLYKPCWDILNGKLNPNGTAVIEAYARHKELGIVSATETLTLTFIPGCCGNIVMPIRFRAYQQGSGEA